MDYYIIIYLSILYPFFLSPALHSLFRLTPVYLSIFSVQFRLTPDSVILEYILRCIPFNSRLRYTGVFSPLYSVYFRYTPLYWSIFSVVFRLPPVYSVTLEYILRFVPFNSSIFCYTGVYSPLYSVYFRYTPLY